MSLFDQGASRNNKLYQLIREVGDIGVRESERGVRGDEKKEVKEERGSEGEKSERRKKERGEEKEREVGREPV